MKELRFEPSKCCEVIVVCCILHNFCCDFPLSLNEEEIANEEAESEVDGDNEMDETFEGREKRIDFITSFFS